MQKKITVKKLIEELSRFNPNDSISMHVITEFENYYNNDATNYIEFEEDQDKKGNIIITVYTA